MLGTENADIKIIWGYIIRGFTIERGRLMEEGLVIRENNKVTNLLLYRQYNTYQALLEAYPKNGLTVDGCRSKIILYIMHWFQRRLGEDAIQSMPEIQFLKSDYPSVESYKDFDISKVPDINKLSAIDVKTAYTDEDKSWVFELTEPDNGNEQKDIKGRTFITQILVYLKENTVVFGVKTTCKEPAHNTDDADVYRPGFIKAINSDPDIELLEEGIPYDYRFGDTPIILNGKSSQDCSAIYTQLIANPKRQLPIVFLSESLYEKDEETKEMLNGRTRSYLGFAHVVVVTRSNQKLFRNEMNDLELLEVISEGQVILYRSNPGLTLTVEPVYFAVKEEVEETELEKKNIDDGTYNEEYTVDDTEEAAEKNDGSEEINQGITIEEDEFEKLDLLVKKLDPLRRNYDYGQYSFTAKLWNPKRVMESKKDSHNNSEQIKVIMAEKDHLRAELEEKNRDNEELQRRINEFELSRKRIEKQYYEAIASANRMERIASELQEEYSKVKEQIQRYESRCLTYEKVISGANDIAREKFKPLIHFPRFDMSGKGEILDWIEDHYSKTLIVHPNARRSFFKDNRNIDWRCLCMMIHFISGYTLYRNDGGSAISSDAARDYDPDGYGFKCDPVSSGAGGSKKMYEDKYTIDISAYNSNKADVVMDLHLAQGKGRGYDMIRIYFYYDSEIKKSIIGHMPAHLPTRSDPH